MFIARPDDPVGRAFWSKLVPDLIRDGVDEIIYILF
jgi:hypothetical protein